MKNLFKIIIFIWFTSSLNAQQPESITIGTKDVIHSRILGENRTLWIYNPNLTSSGPVSAKKYPVMFILDGSAHFYSTAGIVQQMSQANGNGVLPEMLIVGIESTDRLKDFVPAANPSGTLDGANLFVKFLANELIPFMDTKYNAAPYRLLAGHSLGGLLTMDILSNYPDLFNAYIAIDPSMWMENEKFLNQNLTAAAKQKYDNTKLFVGIANTLPEGMSLAHLKTNPSDETKHIRSIFKLGDFLKKNKMEGLKYEQKYYGNENHNSVPLISEYDGLRFIFDYYRLNVSEKELTDSTPAIVTKIKSHYAKISKEMGYKVSAPESVIQYLGYDALAKKQNEKVEALFLLNISNYPESAKAYDAYADYFAARKDTANAVKYYKTALSKGHSEAVQNKLNILTGLNTFNISSSELQKYTGIYTILTYMIDIELYIRENKLWSKVPGEADEELVPVSKNVFTLKDKQGYTITFDSDGSKTTGFTSVQPNGTFKAIMKK